MVFTLILFGCDPSSFAPLKISDEQKARDSLQQENPKTIAETTTTKNCRKRTPKELHYQKYKIYINRSGWFFRKRLFKNIFWNQFY